MRNKLLATVAVAAVVGFGGFAAAQSQMGGESNKAGSGAMSGTSLGATQQKNGIQSGNKTLSPSSTQSSNPSRNESAQGKSGKDTDRLGQSRSNEQMNHGAQQEKSGTEQKGAQQERGTLKNQKGAQEESGKNLKGAQEQRGMQQKGAQEQRGIRAGANVGTSGGGSVQLSEDQRSRIKTVIGSGRGPRLSRSNVNFDISVGTHIPRTVHFVTLPSEIVLIVPQYRGFDYFLVEDEIVIVDPRTLEIVAIIPA